MWFSHTWGQGQVSMSPNKLWDQEAASSRDAGGDRKRCREGEVMPGAGQRGEPIAGSLPTGGPSSPGPWQKGETAG